MNLLELIGELSTTKITIRGREVVVRALTADELSSVQHQLPLPKRRQSERRSRDTGKMELFFDDQHPEYVRELGTVSDLRSAVYAGIGLGVDGPPHTGGAAWSKDWKAEQAKAYAAHITAAPHGLTAIEIDRVLLAQRDIVSPPARGDTDRIGTGTDAGNSSAPLPAD